MLRPLTMSSREPSKMLLPPCERSVSTVSWNFLSCGQGGKGHTCDELCPGLSPLFPCYRPEAGTLMKMRLLTG